MQFSFGFLVVLNLSFASLAIKWIDYDDGSIGTLRPKERNKIRFNQIGEKIQKVRCQRSTSSTMMIVAMIVVDGGWDFLCQIILAINFRNIFCCWPCGSLCPRDQFLLWSSSVVVMLFLSTLFIVIRSKLLSSWGHNAPTTTRSGLATAQNNQSLRKISREPDIHTCINVVC